jgi:hypothetical protein
MLDAGVDVELHGYRIPSGLQWNCPGMAVLMVVSYKTPQVAAFVTASSAQSNRLGLGVLGSGGSHRNHWIPCKADTPYKYSTARDGATTKIMLAMPPIKAQSSPTCVICMQGKNRVSLLNHYLDVGPKRSQDFSTGGAGAAEDELTEDRS